MTLQNIICMLQPLVLNLTPTERPVMLRHLKRVKVGGRNYRYRKQPLFHLSPNLLAHPELDPPFSRAVHFQIETADALVKVAILVFVAATLWPQPMVL